METEPKNVTVRLAGKNDLAALLELYTFLHGAPAPAIDAGISKTWQTILADENHHIILVEENGLPAASCVLLVVPNLTHNARPYGLVENVVTREGCRRRGYAKMALQHAAEIAIMNHCYKLMLMTGGREEGSLTFYEKAGYNRRDKTAFVRWLD